MNKGINYPILGYAPGAYVGSCKSCNEEFIGDKYATHCEICAINLLNESHKNLLIKNREMENMISKIKDIKQYLEKL